MTLDEAIEHVIEVAKEQKLRSGICTTNDNECDKFSSCIKCAEEHEQLAEWLEELKTYKSLAPRELISEKQKNDRTMEYSKGFDYGFKIGYKKSIDDFVKEICKMYVQSERNGNYRFYAVEIKQAIADLAEQLKAGITND